MQNVLKIVSLLEKYMKKAACFTVFPLYLTACSDTMPQLEALLKTPGAPQLTESVTASLDHKQSLDKGVSYWRDKHIKDPKDHEISLRYANSLVLAGRNTRALQVLASAMKANPENAQLTSEYGRLALRLNRISLAEKVLTSLDDGGAKDWRVLSARGAILSKRGKHKEAREFFEQALKLSPDEPAAMNNLALNYALSGQPKKAEELLVKLVKNKKADPKIVQNLALVLGLQGKFSDAEVMAKTTLPEKAAESNIKYLRRLVNSPGQESKASEITH